MADFFFKRLDNKMYVCVWMGQEIGMMDKKLTLSLVIKATIVTL